MAPRTSLPASSVQPPHDRTESERLDDDVITLTELPAVVESWGLSNEWLCRLGLDRVRLRLLSRNPKVPRRVLISKRRLSVWLLQQFIDHHARRVGDLEVRQRESPTERRAEVIACGRAAASIFILMRDFVGRHGKGTADSGSLEATS